MSLMTSIYVGVSGLNSSQNAIHTTSHNLSNVNTEGYVRQQATFTDTNYQTVGLTKVGTWQIGLGVASDDTRHIRDYFLDKSYRTEAGREGFYTAQSEAVTELETIFGELEGQAFQDSLTALQEAISELAKTPSLLTARSGLVMYAEEFLNRANAIYEDMITYQKNLDVQVQNTVDRINALGDEIQSLNIQISGFEATGVEMASDLRDKRDLAIDELASLVNITYAENEDHIVNVKIEGIDFVTESATFHLDTMELDGAEGSTYKSVVWPYLNNKELYYFNNDVSTAAGNDIGKLKGLLMARGDFVADYTDMPVEGADDYAAQVKYYHDNIEYSTIMKTQAMFDQLIHGIVTTINDLLVGPEIETTLTEAATYTLADGSTITFAAGDTIKTLDLEHCSFGSDPDKTPGTELFSRSDAERYIKATDADGNTVYIYNEKNEFEEVSLYTLGNLVINQKILEDYSFIPLTTAQGDEDQTRASELLTAFNKEFANLNPDNLTPKTFMEYYTGLVGEIGNTGFLYASVASSQATVVANVDNARWSKYGVSSEEELSNLIKYQNAYNANSRYVSTISDMIAHIINTLGV